MKAGDTCCIGPLPAPRPLSGRLDELLQTLIVDVRRRPLRHLVP